MRARWTTTSATTTTTKKALFGSPSRAERGVSWRNGALAPGKQGLASTTPKPAGRGWEPGYGTGLSWATVRAGSTKASACPTLDLPLLPPRRMALQLTKNLLVGAVVVPQHAPHRQEQAVGADHFEKVGLGQVAVDGEHALSVGKRCNVKDDIAAVEVREAKRTG